MDVDQARNPLCDEARDPASCLFGNKQARGVVPSPVELPGSSELLALELSDAIQLQKISTRLIGEDDLPSLYREILSAAMTIMRSDFGSMQMFDPLANHLRLLTWKGFHPDSAEFWREVPVQSTGGSCSNAASARARTIVEDCETCDFIAGTPDLDHFRLCGIRSMQSTPLMSRSGEIVGMISTHWRQPHVPTDRDWRVFDVLARQAADLIERTRAEERRKLLLAELNHRVKNTLAVVQSLAQQSFQEHLPLSESRAAFEGRLQALAGAHDVLTRENWESANLLNIVSGALDACGVSEQVTVNGPPLKLDPRSAVTISMALHELCTNAIKYGALSASIGCVLLGWRIDGSGDRRRLQIRWEEHGGPPVEPPKRRGFGSRMLERAVAADLRAAVSMDYRREGLVCDIDAPAPPGQASLG